MGKKRSLPYWLPAGWKVEVQGRNNKWYSDPSKGVKFCSKADVLRYLSSVGSNCSKSSNTKEMKKNGTGKFLTEKAVSEGLPPGWIKEMRVRRKGHKIRKDAYYIDPVCGQTFRSMKEVSRFLDTRESGRLESKPRVQCPSISELGESFSSLPAETDQQIPKDNDASGKGVNLNQKLKLGAEQMAHSSCVEGSVSSFEDPVSREHQEKEDDGKGVLDPASGEHIKKEDDGKVVSDPVSGEYQEKPSRDRVEKHDQETIQRKRKKGLNLPLRTSKRLAGIKADTSLELQTNNQAHVATGRQEEETQAATTNNPGNLINTSKLVATAVTGITISEKLETGSLTRKRQQNLVTVPRKECELASPTESAKTVLACCEGERKVETALGSSSSDIWTDPCIEFAIKTLTGTLAVNANKANEIPGSCLSMPSVNAASSMALPSEEIWADPCFMFAVKTLTGEISIGDDELSSQKIVQQQCTSPQFRRNGGLLLPNIRYEEFDQANLSHFGAPEKALYKQQPAVALNVYQNCLFTKFGSHQSSPLC